MIMLEPSAAKEQGKKLISIRAADYSVQFYLEDGANMTFRRPDYLESATRPCTYIDDYHFLFGSSGFHVDQFAEMLQRTGGTCEPEHHVTDLTVYPKFYADRSLKDTEGKLIPYRAIIGLDPDPVYRDPQTIVAICPEAEPDRQVVCRKRSADRQTITSDFYSVRAANIDLLPSLELPPNEFDLLHAVLVEHDREMIHISQAKWDKLPNDFKGRYADYQGEHPEWVGRRTGFIPGHGTTLFIEGVSFVIDHGKAATLDQQIQGAEQRKPDRVEKGGDTPTHTH